MSGKGDSRRDAAADRTCDQCGEWVPEDAVLYDLNISIRAEPRANPGDLGQDLRSMQDEWDEILARMEAMSEAQVDEAVDQVFEEYHFHLCPACRKELHRRLKRRNLLP